MSLYTQLGAFVAVAIAYTAFAFGWTWYRRRSSDRSSSVEATEDREPTEDRP